MDDPAAHDDVLLPPPMPLSRAASFSIQPKYWGYVVRTPAHPSGLTVFLQSVAWFFGACFIAASLGIFLLPLLLFDTGLNVLSVALAVLFLSIAIYLLNYASRGVIPHVEVDRRAEEIREVLTHRIGGGEVIARIPFRAISGLYFEEGENGQARLLVERPAGRSIPLATGPSDQLERLRLRIGKTLLGEE